MAIQTPVPGYTVTQVAGEHTFSDAVVMLKGATVTGALSATSLAGNPFVTAPASVRGDLATW